MSDFETTRIFSYDVYADDLANIKPGEKKQIVNTINAYSYVVATKDKTFQEALMRSDILLPDGFPIVTAAKWINKVKITKIAGADIFFHLCEYLNQQKGSCFFLGASQQTLDKIKTKMAQEYPHIKSGFYSPPYKKEFTPEDSEAMCQAVAEFKPDVLYVGMTAPKQEKWVHQHAKQLEAKIVCSIGAVFDFYAGSVERPSDFWVNNNLEWFIRLLKEPKRLWKRYLVYSPLFFLDVFGYMIFPAQRRRYQK